MGSSMTYPGYEEPLDAISPCGPQGKISFAKNPYLLILDAWSIIVTLDGTPHIEQWLKDADEYLKGEQ